ncbi:TrmH family RNA methyltransferase [Seminibacterium arietis]|uniref:TrmH family RNA methyltransferase n=1 Tax=Seminibacterium arietis TaxID=1173502 RepID=A0ABW3I9X0_9PAST
MNVKKTVFQSSRHNYSSRFSQNQLDDKNLPHFRKANQAKLRSEKHSSDSSKKKKEYRKQENIKKEYHFSQTTLSNARHTGEVKVIVKSGGKIEKKKKTGPLSPRAPEKIKKNRAEEMKICGEASCLSLFEKRPESIVRVWATVEMAHKIGELFSYLATNKKVYHVVTNKELELVSGTEHHGGICMLIKKRHSLTLQGYLDIPRKQDCLVLLENVKNPYNIGGIIRVCAFYGVSGIICSEPELFNSATAVRVAEGGVEYVNLLQVESAVNAIEKLRSMDYQIVRLTNNKQASSLESLQVAKKSVIVLSEVPVESAVEKYSELINLSHKNPLKGSINVAVASGVLLSKITANYNLSA